MTTFDATVGASVLQSPINFSGSGDNIIVAGLSGQSIRIFQFFLVLAGATTLTYKSGSTAISGPMTFPGAAAQVQDFVQLPLHCNQGDSFVINSSSAVQFGGIIWFAQS